MSKPNIYTARLLVKIKPEDSEALKKYASDNNITISDFIRDLYTRKLKRENYL